MYVSPALVSASGEVDKKRLAELEKGIHKTEDEVNDMDLADAVNELVLFIKHNLAREAVRLQNTFIRNISGVSVKADVSLRPEEVINELLKEKKAGSFKFKKDDTIEDVHVDGNYINHGIAQATGTIGGGEKGKENLKIPGATYLSQDGGTKVAYDSVDLTPLSLAYEQNVYDIKNKSILMKGLKFAVKKK